MIINNISNISSNALCTACGACAGICPSNAIEIVTNTAGYLAAVINTKLCIDCGKCAKICPSNPENKPSIETDDIFHGVCLAGYVGCASDNIIRQRSQSGGIVTALLCYLFEQKEIEGAIVNNLNPETKRPQAVFASSMSEIIEASGSYYAQSSVVKTILEHSDKKSAAVVLGCQAESLQLIREKYPNINLPTYTIGLVCAGQYSGDMIDDLIEQSGCDGEKISEFRFRDKRVGWPGDVHVKTPSGDYWLPKERRHSLKQVYELHRCMVCYDQMNIFCDIVCGDPWGISHKQNPEGYTVVIARTTKGKKILESAAKDGAVILEELSPEDILRGQTVDGRHKTKFYNARDIFREHKWLFPYPDDDFNNIPYASVENKIKMQGELNERLIYTRDLYLTPDREEYLRKIILKKKELQGNILRHLKEKIKRFGRVILR
ncbi:coenzyme F420 hydrogenase/dehydrogenase beta subunit domain protein [Methanofollis liminatans DSM 4140]|uniref:Coenzyme F420 hydrogenase/dehydrogenase beta subunit domain protein n=1 Tax=Methanofollis liminatans DSM 4140 TaxID=28892 RepID=J1L1E8_9EURY|nr:Coenzyme F420 hydrogenase/dehydrogenase, beta subunit C-terminal domain [Methanofollis liminatans]EJG06822.1 coenzyme F420 hydrogenase/dehydrogenase beta subunit domain protein [Methanofollis liminatans DSM 4140]